jgi:hypothetical protein
MTHLTRADLTRWRDAPDPADRDRIVLHLAECDECGALYADLMRTRPAAAGPDELEPAAFMKAGFEAGPVPQPTTAPAIQSTSPARSGMWRRVAIPLAAAAVVILGVTTLLRRDSASFRGGDNALQLSAPSGTVATGALTFQWTAPPDTPSQRLLVYALDDPSQPAVDAKNVTSPFRLTGEQAARLRPGTDYRWMIEFTTRDGRVETSPATAFRLR